MVKFRRTTKSALIFEDDGEMHSFETDVDITMMLPKWALKVLKGAARLNYLAKLEIQVWQRSDISLLDKILCGFHAA